MQTFYSVKGNTYFSPQVYLEAWENVLFAEAQRKGEGKQPSRPSKTGDDTEPLESADVKLRRALLQRTAANVQKLWRQFNAERSQLGKNYLDEDDFIAAYLASFHLPNCERIFQICTKPEVMSALKALLERGLDTLTIADFGSGPLAATVGFLASLESILWKFPHLKKPQLEILAIERSQRSIELGFSLLQSARLDDGRPLQLGSCPSPDKIPHAAHVILCANVFNEIPAKHHLATARKLYGKLQEGGLFLVVEPGQDVHAKNLGSLRDDFLDAAQRQGEPVSIVAPCAHCARCPLSSRTDRKDWCWFQSPWRPPRLLAELDTHTRLNHGDLNYSFLCIEKSHGAKNAPFARVVSAPMTLNFASEEAKAQAFRYAAAHLSSGSRLDLADAFEGKSHASKVLFSKVLLCTREGKLESCYFKEQRGGQAHVQTVPHWQRGDVVPFPTDVPLRVEERVRPLPQG